MLATRRISIAVAFLFPALAAHAQVRAPSVSNLQTAYCIPIVKGELEVAQQAVLAQEKSLAEINAAAASSDIVKAATEVLDNLRGEAARFRALLSRMESDLSPGTSELDPAALSKAENRGKADWQSLVAMRNAMDRDLVQRIGACEKPA